MYALYFVEYICKYVNKNRNNSLIGFQFLCMDPIDVEMHETMLSPSNAAGNQASPRRKIETGRTVTPSGTVVTTSTTTTERPMYGRNDTALDGTYRVYHLLGY
jgi:hypothetical protein